LRIVPFKALKVVRIARMDKLPVRARVKVLPIGSAGVAVRGFGPFASGMAARKGEDPLAGLQRSQQPGPQGDAQFLARRIPQRRGYDERRTAIRFAKVVLGRGPITRSQP
jgi:hypothetical protein